MPFDDAAPDAWAVADEIALCCSADDIAKIEQFKEHSRLPGVKVKTFSCTKASSND